MKKKLIIVIVCVALIIIYWTKMKVISFTDKTNINTEIKMNLQSGEVTKHQTDDGWIFYVGKVEYPNMGKLNSTALFPSIGKSSSVKSFKNPEEFFVYVNDIKVQSDKAMEVIKTPGYKREDIDKSIQKNKQLFDIVQQIDVPEDAFKTSAGKYFADNLLNDSLQTLLTFRNKLLEDMEKMLDKRTKSLERDIASLQNGVISNKEAAYEFSSQSMMEEEGYAWNSTLKKYVLKK